MNGDTPYSRAVAKLVFEIWNKQFNECRIQYFEKKNVFGRVAGQHYYQLNRAEKREEF